MRTIEDDTMNGPWGPFMCIYFDILYHVVLIYISILWLFLISVIYAVVYRSISRLVSRGHTRSARLHSKQSRNKRHNNFVHLRLPFTRDQRHNVCAVSVHRTGRREERTSKSPLSRPDRPHYTVDGRCVLKSIPEHSGNCDWKLSRDLIVTG